MNSGSTLLLDSAVNISRRIFLEFNYRCGLPFTRLPDGSNTVLMFHSVGDDRFYGNVTIKRFRKMVELLATSTFFEIVSAGEITNTTWGKRRIAFTFDDGLRNFYTNAFPVLREFDVPVTVFVSPSLIGTHNQDLIERRYRVSTTNRITMNEIELSEISNDDLVSLGNHTRTHPDLTEITQKEIETEVVGAKSELECRFGQPITLFCYPYGHYSEGIREIVSESHELAFTADDGVVTDRVDPCLIPRVHAHRDPRFTYWSMTRSSKVLTV